MKRKTKGILLALVPLMVLTSCATTYQREGVFANGYSDFRLKEDTFVITFRANEYTPPEKVMQYALKRAAELTIHSGYRFFTLLDQSDSHLQYPSLRLTIKCFEHLPPNPDAIDAKNYLAYNGY